MVAVFAPRRVPKKMLIGGPELSPAQAENPLPVDSIIMERGRRGCRAGFNGFIFFGGRFLHQPRPLFTCVLCHSYGEFGRGGPS